MTTNFDDRLASLRESYGAADVPAPAPRPVVEHRGDGVKNELKALDLLSIYRAWFAPAAERRGGGDEVNLSCFNTDFHARGDKNPQFGINTAKQTYHCHACGVSGDIIDLAAVRWGLAGPDHRCPDDRVHEAVKCAGEELLGYTFAFTGPGGWQKVPQWDGVAQPAAPRWETPESHLRLVPPTPPAYLPPAPPPVANPTMLIGELGGVSRETAGPDLTGYAPPVRTAADFGQGADRRAAQHAEDAEEARLWEADFSLDWRAFVPERTPLRSYMEIVTSDDTPEEFHFWNFMSLLGLTLGKKVFTPDTKPVYGNLLTCVIGRSGQGKSRAEEFVHDLIAAAAPFNEHDHLTTGIKVIKNPGSGEYLASQFLHEIPDPTAEPGKGREKAPMLRNPSVKALVRWPEMATMIGKSQGKGSIIQQTVIELYDVPRHIGGGSMTNGSYGADNPFGSVATTTQLKTLRKLVSSDDAASGFLNRWLFIIGKSKPRQARGRIVDVAPVVPHMKRLQEWTEKMARDRRGRLDLDDDTPGGSGEVYDRIVLTKAVPLEEDSSEMLSRAVLTFKKLVLLFSANMMEEVISVEAIRQAEIAFDYLVDCLRHIGVRLQRGEFDELEAAITETIVAAGQEGATGTDLRRVLKRKDPAWTTDVVNKALEVLQKAGKVELATIPQPGGRPGRPLKRYFLVAD